MSKKLLSCAMAFLMTFSIMPCAAFAEEASVEGQVESLEAEKPAEDDAFGEGGLDEAFFAEFLLLQGFTLTSSMAQMIITD